MHDFRFLQGFCRPVSGAGPTMLPRAVRGTSDITGPEALSTGMAATAPRRANA